MRRNKSLEDQISMLQDRNRRPNAMFSGGLMSPRCEKASPPHRPRRTTHALTLGTGFAQTASGPCSPGSFGQTLFEPQPRAGYTGTVREYTSTYQLPAENSETTWPAYSYSADSSPASTGTQNDILGMHIGFGNPSEISISKSIPTCPPPQP